MEKSPVVGWVGRGWLGAVGWLNVRGALVGRWQDAARLLPVHPRAHIHAYGTTRHDTTRHDTTRHETRTCWDVLGRVVTRRTGVVEPDDVPRVRLLDRLAVLPEERRGLRQVHLPLQPGAFE